MNLKERAVIEKQKKEDGEGGQSITCSKHKIKMQLVSIGATHVQFACPKCQEEKNREKR